MSCFYSRDLLYRYYHHLLDSRTVFATRKFSDQLEEGNRERETNGITKMDTKLGKAVPFEQINACSGGG